MEKIFAAGPDITQLEIDTVVDALKNGWYENAYYYCETFQKEFAVWHGRKYGIMTPNCTTAIHLLLAGLGVSEGDEVIVPESTWIGSTAGIKWLGAKALFCDVLRDSWCLDPAAVERAITPRTKAIITVNLYGNMSDMVELSRIADRYGLYLIEDAAESLGSKLNGIRSGKFGIGSTFSFHRTKTLTTGEGGMLLIDDDKLYDRCMFLRDHGRSRTKAYFIDEVAYKYMPFNVQAALGYAQFLRLDELVERKRRQFYLYRDNLGGLLHLLQLNHEPSNVLNCFWITAVVFDKSLGMDTSEIIHKLVAMGIPARPFFYPLSSLPAYNEFNQYRDKNVVAYDIYKRAINLPGAANMTDEQTLFVCDGLRKIVMEKL